MLYSLLQDQDLLRPPEADLGNKFIQKKTTQDYLSSNKCKLELKHE